MSRISGKDCLINRKLSGLAEDAYLRKHLLKVSYVNPRVVPLLSHLLEQVGVARWSAEQIVGSDYRFGGSLGDSGRRVGVSLASQLGHGLQRLHRSAALRRKQPEVPPLASEVRGSGSISRPIFARCGSTSRQCRNCDPALDLVRQPTTGLKLTLTRLFSPRTGPSYRVANGGTLSRFISIRAVK